MLGFWRSFPVVTSYSQPCQGQVTILSCSDPCPSGPPLCRQVLLIAKNLPATFASAKALPSTCTSWMAPAGTSEVLAARANGMFAPRKTQKKIAADPDENLDPQYSSASYPRQSCFRSETRNGVWQSALARAIPKFS